MDKQLGTKGTSTSAIVVAESAIMLIIVIVIIAQILPTAVQMTATSTEATAAAGNVSNYTWIAISLSAVGIIVMGGLGLVYMLMRKK